MNTEIMRSLIQQVSKASSCMGNVPETQVVTFITRPLWREFLKQCGNDPADEPTGWVGIHETRRVYGSETIIVESPSYWSMSTRIENAGDWKP